MERQGDPTPKELFGVSYPDWISAFERFGPHPERAREEVDYFFDSATATESGGQFFYRVPILLPLAKAYRHVAVDFRAYLVQGLEASLESPQPEQRPADFPGYDEAWRGFRDAAAASDAELSFLISQLDEAWPDLR